MNIYQVYYNNGLEYEDYECYDVLCTDLTTAINFRPENEDENDEFINLYELETLYELRPSSSGYFRILHVWRWKNNHWELEK